MKYLVPALLAALVCSPALSHAKEADLSTPLPVDERIAVRETLPNGMQLWIRPHQNPPGKVSMILRIAAGALNETEAQRGLAHYIEHMAFNGSKNFPPDTLIKKFESIGGQFGRDVNAFTGFDLVGYMLNLPNTKDETLDLGLLFFSDVANGLGLTQPELDKERPVILEEQRARDDPSTRVMEKLIDVLAPGSLISQRLPGGIESVIVGAPRDEFVRYYKTWYRPDIATLMIVGDVDPAKVAAMARKAFAGWTPAVTGEAKTPDSGIGPIEKLRAAIVTDPDLTVASSGISQVLPPRARKTEGDLRNGFVERLGGYMAQQRLTRRMQEGNAPYQDASIDLQPFIGGYRIASASVESEIKNWAGSLQALFEELRRVGVHGFLEEELARAKTAFLTVAEQRVDSAGSTPSNGILMRWTQGMRPGRLPISQKQALALARKLLPTITAKEVHARFNEMFRLDAGVLTMTVPPAAKAQVDEAALLNMAKKAAQQDVEPPKSETTLSKLLDKAPTPGTVASEAHNTAIDATKWVLSNGVVVLVKPMPKAKVVSAQVGMYGGLIDETSANRGITALVGLAMGGSRAATKRHSPREISEYLNDKKVSVGLSPGEVSASVVISGPPDDLEAGFELAHVLISEPRIDDTSFEAAKRQLVTQLEGASKQLESEVMLRLRGIRSKGDLRMSLPPIETVQSITREAAQTWMDQLIANAPIEVVIAGNITLERAKALALKYFGSLPPRITSWEDFRKKRTVQIAKGPIEESITVDTATSKAFVAAGWTGVGKGDPVLRARMMQAGFMLRSRMNSEIREKRGLTYSANAGYSMTAYDGMDQLILQFTSDPKKVVSAAKIARELVVEFAEKGPSPEEVMSTQMMLGTGLSSQMEIPGFWASVLSSASLEATGLDGVAVFLGQVMKVEGEAVKAAVQTVVKPDRFIQVVGMPKGAKAGNGEKAPEKTEEKKAEPAGIK